MIHSAATPSPWELAARRFEDPAAEVIEDPVEFAEELGIDVWGDNRYGMRAMLHTIRDEALTVVYAGAAVSKTFSMGRIIAPWWLQWPDSWVIATSGTWPQLIGQLWQEVHSVYEEHLKDRAPFCERPPKTAASSDGLGWKLSRNRRFYLRSPNRRGHFTGFHALRVLIIGDEGHSQKPWFPKTVRTAIKTNPNHRVVMPGNPIESIGAYFGLQNDPHWTPVWISQMQYAQYVDGYDMGYTPTIVRDDSGRPQRDKDGAIVWDRGPRVTDDPPGPVRGMDLDPAEPFRTVEEIGEHDPQVQSYQYGQFPKPGGGVAVPFPPHAVSEAFKRIADFDPSEPVDIGIDVAGGGAERDTIGDRSCAMALQPATGWSELLLDYGPSEIAQLPVEDIDAYLDVLADHIDDRLQQLQARGAKIRAVKVDCDGLGVGLAHNLSRRGYPVAEFHAEEIPPRKEAELDDRKPALQYATMRDYGWWYLSKLLPRLSLAPELEDVLRDELLAHLPTYVSVTLTEKRLGDSKSSRKGKKVGVKAIVSKRDHVVPTIGGSPDRGDSLMLAGVPIEPRGAREVFGFTSIGRR